MLLDELVHLVLGLILTVVGKGYDAPLGCGGCVCWSGYGGAGFRSGSRGRWGGIGWQGGGLAYVGQRGDLMGWIGGRFGMD